MRIILVGYGVVGQSLTYILSHSRLSNLKEYGFNPRVVAIVDRKGAAIDSKGLNLREVLRVKKEKGTVSVYPRGGKPGIGSLEVIETVEAEVLVETTPTNIENGEPGLSNIKTGFKSGKHVVTTNKGPLAIAFPALCELADYNKVNLRFSGTVGGGTPVLEFAKKCLLGDKINSIHGILNGTTNYILSEMEDKGLSFQQALDRAKQLGYAETDPSMDIDGIDPACKVVIMANWIMGKKITLKDVKFKGIRNIALETLSEATKRGKTVKLVGASGGDCKVEPTELHRYDPLCVSGVLNAVKFVSEFAGEETIIGRGAGGKETASAILRDMLDIRHNLANKLLS